MEGVEFEAGQALEASERAPAKVRWRNRSEADANEAAREMAAARDRYLHWYASAYKTTVEDAVLIDEAWRRENLERILAVAEDKPADQVQWYDIEHLGGVDPARAEALWTRVRMEAREELESGWRASRVMECDGFKHGPWERARFLALRDALREEWRPRVGVESSLVDMLAQIQAMYETWMMRHVHRMTYSAVEVSGREKEALRDEGRYITPRVTEHAETEQTAAMADRWQRAYLRTVRALRDLRRHSGVVIQNAGQVNIGEQQVNVVEGDL